MGVEFLVLGPIEARRDGDPVPLGGAQQRRLLAILLSAPGQMLSLDRLEETLWPHGNAPDGARRTLFTYVSRLRAALGDGHVVTRDAGYLLDAGADALDSVVFEGLIGAARSAASTLRVALLDQALALWRGPAFGEFASEWWAHPISARLEELRLVANEDRIDALLELGDADRAVSEAEGFAAAYPLRERPVAQLMRARLVTGRQAEALRAFQAFRENLREQTGLDPSPALVELERSIAAGVAPDASSTSRVARGYVLGDVLGQGSFGTVFRATQPGVGREVAVKVVRSELANDPSFVQRFEAEAQLVARLEHPHIVPLYDFWREPGGAYLVFRLMRGGSAEQWLVTDGAWPLDRVSRLVEQIGGALAAAHAAGVIHRDVKPANVLYDDGGNAHLADFGIAATDETADVGGMYSAGSPLYASPEQFQHAGVSVRSDLYSFGATVWELLAGVPPFEGDTASTIARVKLERPVPSLARLRPDLAPTIDAVLQKATAVDPADRFASAIDLVLAWRAAVEARAAASTDDGIARTSSMRQQAAQTMTELTIAATNPYKGLRPFAEADARDYFGRAALVDDLVRAVCSSRVTMVVGSSGSGKSSLLFAGLLPRLRTSGTRIVTMVPTDRPCAQLQTALLSVAVEPVSHKLEHAVEFVADESPNELVIVVDQFEEVWTLTNDVEERDRFVALLRRLAVDDSINVRLVFAIRADFFDRPLSEPELGSIVAKNVFSIAPMTAAELSEAVRAPANAAGVTFEPGLDAEIVADVVNQTASLPLLQFALAELYAHRRGVVIPTAAYRELGGVAGAVAARAEAVYAQLDAAGQRETRRLFSRLVTPGAGAEDTRRRARRSELPGSANAIADQFVAHRLFVVDRDPATREPTIDIAHEALLNRWPRLRGWLDEDREQLQLMRHLSAAADEWDEAGRRDTDLYRGPRLSIVGEINDAGNVILAPVEDEFLSASRTARDDERQQERHRVAQQAKQNHRLRRSLVAAGIMLIVAVLAGSVALVQRNRADDQRALAAAQRDAAEKARYDADTARREAIRASDRRDIERMVAQSRADAKLAPDRSMLLAIEAYKREPTWQTQGALQSVLAQQPKGLLTFIAGQGPFGQATFGNNVLVAKDGNTIGVWDARDFHRLRMITVDGVITVGPALSADEQLVAFSTSDGVAVVNVGSGDRVALLPELSDARSIAFDPSDANRLAVGLADGSLEVVRWRSNQIELRIAAHTASVEGLSFSRDGQRILSRSLREGSVRVWDARNAAAITPSLRGRGTGPFALAFASVFSQSGSLVAALFTDKPLLRVWNVVDGSVRLEIPLHDGEIPNGMTFIGDSVVVTATSRGVRLWDLATGTELQRPFSAFEAVPIGMAVNPTGDTVAIVRFGQLEIWALDERQLGARASAALPPASGAGVDVNLSMNGDGTRALFLDVGAYVFDLTVTPPTRRAVGFPGVGNLIRAAYTADGRTIVTVHIDSGSLASNIRLWDASTFEPRGAPTRLPILATTVAVSPDLRLVAAYNGLDLTTTSTVRVFDLDTGLLRMTLEDLDRITTSATDAASAFRYVADLAFSPNSKKLAAANVVGAAVLWDVDSQRATPLAAGAGDVRWLNFDPTGSELVTVNSQGQLTLLDSASQTARLARVGGRVTTFRPQYNPTKPLLVSDSTCGRLDPGENIGATQIWDTENGTELGIGFPLTCAAWAPDGTSFAAIDATSLQIWDIDPQTWVAAACRFVGRNLTRDEWTKYGPNKPYRETCP
ncbi:MAG: BTAD domain-containing putative transcriptional regulator [Acidimicrobiales bacterium]